MRLTSMSPALTYSFQLKGEKVKPKEVNSLSFTDKWEFTKRVNAWKETDRVQTVWLSQKRQSFAKAMKEFKDLYQPTEYFVATHTCREAYFDDTFEVFFKTKIDV